MKKSKTARKGIVIKGNDHAYRTGKIKPRWEDLRPVVDAFGAAIETLCANVIKINATPLIVDNLGEDRNYYKATFRVFSMDMNRFGEEYRKIRQHVLNRKGFIKTLEESLEMHEMAERIETFHNTLDIITMSTMAGLGDIIDGVMGRISDEKDREELTAISDAAKEEVKELEASNGRIA